jgi:hypothetical protein
MLSLIAATILFLMASLVILSYPLVVFFVLIKENVGQTLTQEEGYVSLNMHKVRDTWFRLAKNLMSLK